MLGGHTLCIAVLLVLGYLGLSLWPGRVSAASPYACHRTLTPKFIDGRLADWDEPYFSMDRWNWRVDDGVTAVYGGALDVSATVRLAWDPDYLYLAVVVVDDVFAPAPENAPDAGDAVLLRIAPAGVAPGTSCAPLEIVFTLRDIAVITAKGADGKPRNAEGIKIGVARSMLPAPTPPMPAEAGKQPGKRITKLWYELSIPWDLLPTVSPADGAVIGLEAQIIDDDGNGVRGRLKWRGMPGASRAATDVGRIQFAPPVRSAHPHSSSQP